MVDAAEAAGTSTAYVGRRGRGRTPPKPAEVWLRGNARPVLGIGSAAVVGMGLAAGGAVAAGLGPAVVGPLAAATAAVALVTAVLARSAAGLRVGRRGETLLLRLSPRRIDAVPLTVVECVFPGSQPLVGPVLRDVHAAADDDPGPPPTRRVGTLVIRFAERATEWRDRPTFAPWGTWHDGHAVVDGRWCEPLSADVARAISERLLLAKREAAAKEAGR